jgi:hypothetical protein
MRRVERPAKHKPKKKGPAGTTRPNVMKEWRHHTAGTRSRAIMGALHAT